MPIVVWLLAVVDLTQPLAPGAPIWPGGTPLSVKKLSDVSQGYFIQSLSLGEHTGTHVDAPAHFAAGGATVDRIAPADLRAPLVLVDVRDQVARDPDYRVSAADLRAWEQKNGRMPERALVVARTGWEARFSDEKRYRNTDAKGVMHFPGFSAEAVAWLLAERASFVGLGIDTLSTDHGASTGFEVHKALHGAGKYGVENLASLGALPARGATVWVAPLKLAGGSGAPARVLAEVP